MTVTEADEEFFAKQRAPTEAESNAIQKAKDKQRARPIPPSLTNIGEDGNAVLCTPHSDAIGWEAQMKEAFGTRSRDFMHLLDNQLIQVASSSPTRFIVAEQNAAVAAVAGIAPENEMEAMLAVQMTASHFTAMDMLHRAKRASTLPSLQEYGNLATKLLRTFTAQTEALAKLRRGGSQKVTVEHVHVYPGGQAIVGQVNTGGGGDTNGKAHQPYGTGDIPALAFAPGETLPGADPIREPLPVSSGKGQEAVPHPWRGKGERSS